MRRAERERQGGALNPLGPLWASDEQKSGAAATHSRRLCAGYEFSRHDHQPPRKRSPPSCPWETVLFCKCHAPSAMPAHSCCSTERSRTGSVYLTRQNMRVPPSTTAQNRKRGAQRYVESSTFSFGCCCCCLSRSVCPALPFASRPPLTATALPPPRNLLRTQPACRALRGPVRARHALGDCGGARGRTL